MPLISRFIGSVERWLRLARAEAANDDAKAEDVSDCEPLPDPPAGEAIATAFPNGHFYSPVVDPGSLDPTQIWPGADQVREPVGIDFCPESHKRILADVFPRYMPLYDYPEKEEEAAGASGFYSQNSQFSWLDARLLFVLLNYWKPKRYVEVGSGFSSLLAADVNHRFLGDQTEIICIEPYPRPFLELDVPGLSKVLETKVEDLHVDFFSQLQRGDVLFIDSSHVAKTGSDVNFLYFEVLPRLNSGVRVHIHDVFFPFDYPEDWVLGENRSWNEQYLLRALLMYSPAFRVVFGSSFAFWKFPQLVQSALDLPSGASFGGGSFWIEKQTAPE